MLDSRSPLDGLLAAGGRDGADGARRLRLGERRGWHLAQLGHFPGTRSAFLQVAHALLGYDLPDSSVEARGREEIAMRIAVDQYWIVTDDPARLEDLAAGVPADVGAVVPLSGSRARIVLDGPAARAVLARLVPLDLDPRQFPVGRFAQTGLHHVGGLLHHLAPDRYDFYALRTYAATIWEVVADAALPFGYDLDRGG